jgi:rhodanese-related sulfurtransferase
MRYLTLALALIATFVACSKPKPPVVQAKQPAIRSLPPAEFAKLLADTSTLLVNVQPAPKGEIPGTRLLLSGDRAFDSLKVVRPDMTQPIALYCEQGQQSDTMAAKLARAGYASICVLSGGYRSWMEQGLPFRLYDSQK